MLKILFFLIIFIPVYTMENPKALPSQQKSLQKTFIEKQPHKKLMTLARNFVQTTFQIIIDELMQGKFSEIPDIKRITRLIMKQSDISENNRFHIPNRVFYFHLLTYKPLIEETTSFLCHNIKNFDIIFITGIITLVLKQKEKLLEENPSLPVNPKDNFQIPRTPYELDKMTSKRIVSPFSTTHFLNPDRRISNSNIGDTAGSSLLNLLKTLHPIQPEEQNSILEDDDDNAFHP
jgi:hypothetical protein